jgi:hypothetical protein
MNHISFNSGRVGVTASPTPAELAAAHDPHTPPAAVQIEQQRSASRIPTLRYNENKGRPPITAAAQPNDFRGANASLPLARSVAGARPNGPFLGRPAAA